MLLDHDKNLPLAYGVAPSVINSHNTTPNAHTSDFPVNLPSLKHSGDIQRRWRATSDPIIVHMSVGKSKSNDKLPFPAYAVRFMPMSNSLHTLFDVTSTVRLQRILQSTQSSASSQEQTQIVPRAQCERVPKTPYRRESESQIAKHHALSAEWLVRVAIHGMSKTNHSACG